MSKRGRPVEIEHLERAVAVTGIEPPAMGNDAVGAGLIVVHSSAGCVEHDAHETAEPPLEGEVVGVDDIDAGVRAISEVVLGAVRIDPADVVRPQRVAGDLDRGPALGLGVGWRARALARRSGEHRAGCRERPDPDQQRGRDDRGE